MNYTTENRSFLWSYYKEITIKSNRRLKWCSSSKKILIKELLKIKHNNEARHKDNKKENIIMENKENKILEMETVEPEEKKDICIVNIMDVKRNIKKRKNIDTSIVTTPPPEKKRNIDSKENIPEIHMANYETNIKAFLGLKNKKFVAKKLIQHLIKANAINNNLISNIGNVDVNKYKEDGLYKLEPLSKLFCDNIILYKLINPKNIVKSKGGIFLLDAPTTKYHNGIIRKIFNTNNIPTIGAGAIMTKPPILSRGAGVCYTRSAVNYILHTPEGQIIKNNYIASCRNDEEKTGYFIGKWKIELADVEFSYLLENMPLVMEGLKREDIFLGDLDITRDYAYNLDKKKLIKHLLKKDHILQNNKDVEEDDRQYNNGIMVEKKIIIDNDHTVGIDCLTVLHTFNGVKARGKYYNKWISNINSSGINYNLSHHLLHLVNPPNETLKTTYEATDKGTTRVELTIYSHKLHTLEEYNNYIDNFLKDTAEQPLFYKTPYYKQWQAVEEAIENNLLILDKTTNTFYLLYFVNSLTNKFIGIVKEPYKKQKERVTEKELKNVKNYVISAFSFKNKPIHYLEVTHDKENLTVTKETYIKTHGETYLSNSRHFFIGVNQDKLNYTKVGLNHRSHNIHFKVRDTQGRHNSEKPYKVTEIKEDKKTVCLLDKRTRDLIEAKIREATDYNNTKKELLKEKEEYLKYVLCVAEKKKENDLYQQKLDDIGNRLDKRGEKLINLIQDKKYIIKYVMSKVGASGEYFNILLEDEDGKETVYYDDLYNRLVIGSNKNNLIKYNCSNGSFFYGGELDKGFIAISKKKEVWTKSNHKGNYYHPARVIYANFTLDTKYKNNNHIRIKKLIKNETNKITLKIDYKNKENIKAKECLKLSNLKEHTTYTIHEIIPIFLRKKQRYIITLTDNKKYISNFWLEQLLASIDINKQEHNILVKSTSRYSTPSKKKELKFCI